MFYISRNKGRTIHVIHPRSEIRETSDGPLKVDTQGGKILFKPLAGRGFVTNALPVKHGRETAEGYFRSDVAKMRPGLTKEQSEEFLAHHEDYGVDFVAIGDDGKAIGPAEWSTPERRSENYIRPSGDGVYCSLCERQLSTRGLNKHIESSAHMNFLEQAEKQLIRGLDRSAG